jgi:hypothetical protein
MAHLGKPLEALVMSREREQEALRDLRPERSAHQCRRRPGRRKATIDLVASGVRCNYGCVRLHRNPHLRPMPRPA